MTGKMPEHEPDPESDQASASEDEHEDGWDDSSAEKRMNRIMSRARRGDGDASLHAGR